VTITKRDVKRIEGQQGFAQQAARSLEGLRFRSGVGQATQERAQGGGRRLGRRPGQDGGPRGADRGGRGRAPVSDGLPASDKPLRVPVEGEHLLAGVERSGQACALALALRWAFPGLGGVRVDYDQAHAWAGPHHWYWRHDAAAWLKRFDQGRPVRPRVVTLTPFADAGAAAGTGEGG
jgi:hypothetical protein